MLGAWYMLQNGNSRVFMTKIQVIVILQIHFLNKEKHLTDRNIVKQGDIAMAY